MSSVLHHGGDGRRPARPGILGSRCPRTSNLRGQPGTGPVWRSAPVCDEEIAGCTDRADPKSTRHKYCDSITLQAGGLGSGHGDTALRSRVTRPSLLVLKTDPMVHVSVVRCGRDGASEQLRQARSSGRALSPPPAFGLAAAFREPGAPRRAGVSNDRHLSVEYQEVDRRAGEDPGRCADVEQFRHYTLVLATRPGYPPISDSSGGGAVSLLPV